MTKAAELREMSDEQLALTLKDAAEHLFRLRLQAQTERLDAPSELRKQRRLIARVRTIQTQRSIKTAAAAAHGAATAAAGGDFAAAVGEPAAQKSAAQKKDKK
jgi:large subunit ribosomal protein L29